MKDELKYPGMNIKCSPTQINKYRFLKWGVIASRLLSDTEL